MLYTTNSPGRERARQIAVLLAVVALSLGQLPGRVESQLEPVSLYLNVQKGGDLVTGLRAGNFRLYEDGKSQPFRLEKPEEPASIALLVEHSASSGYFGEDIGACLQGFLKHAAEGHWYALATYNRELHIHTDFTKRIGEITDAYSRIGVPLWSEIDTYDAVYKMLDKMGKLPGRRILIVIGSGLDTFSRHTLDQVKKKAETENVTIFAAGLGSLFRGSYESYLDTSQRMTFVQAQAFLRMLAGKTGGFAWFPRMPNAFPDVMQGIMQSIATQYRIDYVTAARGSGKVRKIKMEAFRVIDDKREDFNVLVREGWR